MACKSENHIKPCIALPFPYQLRCSPTFYCCAGPPSFLNPSSHKRMHFPSITIVLCAALACAVPLPMHREPEARALSRRQDIIVRSLCRRYLERFLILSWFLKQELLQARGPISAYRRAPQLSTIQHFARANGGNACIDGALDYILALAIGPVSQTPVTVACNLLPRPA
jgi:hypothetical protein